MIIKMMSIRIVLVNIRTIIRMINTRMIIRMMNIRIISG